MTQLNSRELQLGDTVRLSWMKSSPAWNVAIVQQITDSEIVLWRPYGTTADFSYTGGVICYQGLETIRLPLSSTAEYELLERRTLK